MLITAETLQENGKEKPFIMGCYGIGVTRTLASIVEQHHDENGIIWPLSVAPYHISVIPVNIKDEAQMEIANKLYEELKGEMDPEKRKDLIFQMQQILVDDAAVLIDGYYNSSMIYSKKVGSAHIHTADYYWLSTEITPAE